MLTQKEKQHYMKYAVYQGARWIASCMKARHLAGMESARGIFPEAMMKVFQKMYMERTAGRENLTVAYSDLENILTTFGGMMDPSHMFVRDMWTGLYEFPSISGNYHLCMGFNYYTDGVLTSMEYTLDEKDFYKWTVYGIKMNAREIAGLIRDFLDFLDELASQREQTVEKAMKIIMADNIRKTTKEKQTSITKKS